MYGKGRVELLIDRTQRESNIDCLAQQPRVNTKVWVRCTRCGEELLRAFGSLHQLHACPTHLVRADGVHLKWCNPCEQFLTYAQFGKNTARYDGLNSICRTCCANQPSRKRQHAKKLRRRTTAEGWLKHAVIQKRSDCRKQGIPIDIDLSYLLEAYQQQDGKCFYAKVPLEFGTNGLRSASLERLDSSKGYIKGNVVLASKAMNWAKNASTEADFIKFLLEMLNGLAPFVRLETKTIHPAGQLPFRKRMTDAGFDIHSVEDKIIQAHGTAQIDTGIIVSPPEGTYYSIEGRSSLWRRGIVPFRGIIDGTYQGPLVVVLMNASNEDYEIKSGDRIAQIILHPIQHGDFVLVDEFSPIDEGRAADGFGSSGR